MNTGSSFAPVETTYDKIITSNILNTMKIINTWIVYFPRFFIASVDTFVLVFVDFTTNVTATAARDMKSKERPEEIVIINRSKFVISGILPLLKK